MVDNTSKWGKTTAAKRYAEGGEVARPAYRPRTPVTAAARAEQDKTANFGQSQQAQQSMGSGLMGGAAFQSGTSAGTTEDKDK